MATHAMLIGSLKPGGRNGPGCSSTVSGAVSPSKSPDADLLAHLFGLLLGGALGVAAAPVLWWPLRPVGARRGRSGVRNRRVAARYLPRPHRLCTSSPLEGGARVGGSAHTRDVDRDRRHSDRRSLAYQSCQTSRIRPRRRRWRLVHLRPRMDARGDSESVASQKRNSSASMKANPRSSTASTPKGGPLRCGYPRPSALSPGD
jgi:hypothetical protein